MNDREIIRRHSKSFALAAKLLPGAARARAESLYAWCRSADDLIDDAGSPESAASALESLRREVEDAYAGRPATTPAGNALQRAVASCALPKEYPLELLAGFEMDVRAVRYDTESDLLLYAYRVAGVVGQMMCHALGVDDDRALTHSAHLGMAMQLTNIARDVAEDARRGRFYLPAEWFPEGSRSQAGLELTHRPCADALRRCLQLADRYYTSGLAGLRYLSPRCRPAIRAAAMIYRAIGGRIAAQGYDPSRGRAFVTRAQKLAILCNCTLRSLPGMVARSGDRRHPRSVGGMLLLPELDSSSTPSLLHRGVS